MALTTKYGYELKTKEGCPGFAYRTIRGTHGYGFIVYKTHWDDGEAKNEPKAMPRKSREYRSDVMAANAAKRSIKRRYDEKVKSL